MCVYIYIVYIFTKHISRRSYLFFKYNLILRFLIVLFCVFIMQRLYRIVCVYVLLSSQKITYLYTRVL